MTTDQTTRPTSEELTESLTGFDELAIEKHFDGFDIYVDAEAHPVRSLRALVFIHLRRVEGTSDAEAHAEAAGMPLKDVHEFFEPDEEANPDDPDTESGKGDSPSAGEPTDSQTFASEPASPLVSTTA